MLDRVNFFCGFESYLNIEFKTIATTNPVKVNHMHLLRLDGLNL